ncbi:MAG: hypothetical protein WDM77_08680 [Steroidobacteraceae bacterium]
MAGRPAAGPEGGLPPDGGRSGHPRHARRVRFGGALKSVSLTAHPKLDLHRNELIAFSYQAQGDATLDLR